MALRSVTRDLRYAHLASIGLVGVFLALVLGGTSGYYGVTDNLIERIIQLLRSFPIILDTTPSGPYGACVRPSYFQ